MTGYVLSFERSKLQLKNKTPLAPTKATTVKQPEPKEPPTFKEFMANLRGKEKQKKQEQEHALAPLRAKSHHLTKGFVDGSVNMLTPQKSDTKPARSSNVILKKSTLPPPAIDIGSRPGYGAIPQSQKVRSQCRQDPYLSDSTSSLIVDRTTPTLDPQMTHSKQLWRTGGLKAQLLSPRSLLGATKSLKAWNQLQMESKKSNVQISSLKVSTKSVPKIIPAKSLSKMGVMSSVQVMKPEGKDGRWKASPQFRPKRSSGRVYEYTKTQLRQKINDNVAVHYVTSSEMLRTERRRREYTLAPKPDTSDELPSVNILLTYSKEPGRTTARSSRLNLSMDNQKPISGKFLSYALSRALEKADSDMAVRNGLGKNELMKETKSNENLIGKITPEEAAKSLSKVPVDAHQIDAAKDLQLHVTLSTHPHQRNSK